MKKLYITGLGCGDNGEITLKTLDILKSCDEVFLRTVKHPGAEILKEYDIPFTSFDSLYESLPDFDSLYQQICDEVLSSEKDTVAYVVPGSAVMAERSVFLLLKNAKCETRVIPSTSFLDGIFASLKTDAAGSFKLIDALSMDTQAPDVSCMNIICQVYDRDIAADVKLCLSKYYDDETDVLMVNACGTPDECVHKTKLYEIDRLTDTDHLSTLVIPKQNYMSVPSSFYSLVHIISDLRDESGCPWDKEQTHESLRQYMIEEAYETVNAIDKKDDENLCEELGDMLLQVLLHAKIAQEDEAFDISDVIKGISEKMIRRHPHVFKTREVPEDFYKLWDEIKQKEHSYTSLGEEIQDIPKCLPALIYAQKLGKKISKAQACKMSTDDLKKSLLENIDSLTHEKANCEQSDRYENAGRLLFSAVSLLQSMNIDAESALRDTSRAYLNEFSPEK